MRWTCLFLLLNSLLLSGCTIAVDDTDPYVLGGAPAAPKKPPTGDGGGTLGTGGGFMGTGGGTYGSGGDSFGTGGGTPGAGGETSGSGGTTSEPPKPAGCASASFTMFPTTKQMILTSEEAT